MNKKYLNEKAKMLKDKMERKLLYKKIKMDAENLLKTDRRINKVANLLEFEHQYYDRILTNLAEVNLESIIKTDCLQVNHFRAGAKWHLNSNFDLNEKHKKYKEILRKRLTRDAFLAYERYESELYEYEAFRDKALEDKSIPGHKLYAIYIELVATGVITSISINGIDFYANTMRFVEKKVDRHIDQLIIARGTGNSLRFISMSKINILAEAESDLSSEDYSVLKEIHEAGSVSLKTLFLKAITCDEEKSAKELYTILSDILKKLELLGYVYSTKQGQETIYYPYII